MPYQFLNFLFFIQLPCAVFVYVDARKRKVQGIWFWVVGVGMFTPLFLPFYILLRPRGTSGEWKLSDAISIFFLSTFTVPISLMGLSAVLGITERDLTSWVNLFSFSFIGSLLLLVLPLWFILKVCRRPLTDVGLKRDRLYTNILLGIVLVVPALFIEYAVEEIIVRTSTMIAPSQVELIKTMQDEEHLRAADIWPENPSQLVKFSGAAFLIVILAPAGEELLFRGIAYTSLRQSGRWKSLIITSLFFAIAHMQVIHFIPIFVMGLIFAYLVERTGSLVPAISLHFSINLILMLSWYYYPNLYT